jgi:hypothetical protein
VYPENIIEMNRAFTHGKPEGLSLLNDFSTILVLTKRNEAPHTFMETMPGWVKIYQDPISKLFIKSREKAANHPVWKHINQKGIINPSHPPPWAFPG